MGGSQSSKAKKFSRYASVNIALENPQVGVGEALRGYLAVSVKELMQLSHLW